MNERKAPHLDGLTPDDAARVCSERGLELTIDNAHMIEVWEWDPSRVRVTEQSPTPGSRMASRVVSVWVEVLGGGDETGVREPRRPPPPSSAPGSGFDDA
ncbi:hypothetical protein ACI78R_08510 [Geodermatophilus sp. SYSU D01106]